MTPADILRHASELPHPIRPGDLQRLDRDLTWNQACSLLEGLEKDHHLQRIHKGGRLAWSVA